MIVCKRGVGRPSRAEAAVIEDQILDCARRAFCRQGFAGTSMDDIAAECHMTKHTIYRRFPGKAALLNAVIARDLAQLSAPFDLRCGGDALMRVKATARRCYDFSIAPENIAFFSFLEAEAVYSPDVRARFKDWHGQAIAPVVAAVIRAQQAGELPAADPIHLTETLVDLIDGPCRRLQLGRDDVFHGRTPDAFFEARWALFLEAAASVS